MKSERKPGFLTNKKVKMRWKLFAYLLSFAAILLAILWIMQTVYLDTFYKGIKKSELNKASELLVSNIKDKAGEDETIEDMVDTIAKQYDISVILTDVNGDILYSASSTPMAGGLAPREFKEYYEAAAVNGGKADLEVSGDARDEEAPWSDAMDDKPRFSADEGMGDPKRFPMDMQQSVISVQILDLDGQETVLILKSLITPVDATVAVIRRQLIYISVIMFALSLGMAFLMAKRMSAPIVKINETAKKLSLGEYHIKFDGGDYQETGELSDTLNEAARQLAKVEELQRELIANVSHDLRTPLTMVIGCAEMMRDLPGENTTENIQLIIDEAGRLTNLVNELLIISKLQSEEASLDLRQYDLTDSIHSLLRRYAGLCRQEGYKINFDFNEHVIVEADEFKMYQVLCNLVNNAVNYGGESKTIQINQKIIDNRVRIEVIDDGSGIEEKDLLYIWERYYKADKNHKRSIVGTGLGLSIVKKILKNHNANYGVSSVIGKGSTFWFELPIVKNIEV